MSNTQKVKVLMACSDASGAAIERALHAHVAGLAFHRVHRRKELDRALAKEEWHLAFCDLELADFTALDLVTRISDEGIDIPVVVVNGTGAKEIAIRCLMFGICQFIDNDAQYLEGLPLMVDVLLRRAGQERERRLMEKRLRESEELYVDIFDNTSDLIQCLGPDGRFLYTNRTWREVMGYSELELQSLTLLDVLHPDSTLCCQDRFRRLLQGENLSCITFKFLTKSGETIYLVGDCGSLIKDGGAISTRGIFKNVTDTVKAQEALRITEARYQALYENAPDIYTTLSPTGEILTVNRTGARLLGYDPGELIGESAAKIIHPEDQQRVFACLERQFQQPCPGEDIEYRKIRKDGSIFWVHQRATLEPGGGGPRMLVVCRDVTDRHDLEIQLAHQASHDALTNLINRREFERRLQRLLSAESDPADRHALCFLDLDQFKVINDTCGHIAGDELLRQIAALLQGQLRSRDTLARVGGDEFAVLMEHSTLNHAARLAEKLRATVGSFKFHWRSHRFSIGVSIGIVPVHAGQSMVDTLTRADMACYTAKKDGRNRIHTAKAGTE
ncbi:PAS domain S-box protein [Sulfurisoma sediminicola]|uniref:PAS domain S-box protein n=1 Tax=Sulfurisoma sediminicola TaxID=1381557 RepID=UPI001404A7B9|nr:PAS domain S-box protein [Sulfurisoma sediminicola]